jgi:hypothetical protein
MKREPWEGGGQRDPAQHYILSDRKEVIAVDMPTAALWFAEQWRKVPNLCQVGLMKVGKVEVSTVFIGRDMGWGRGPLPLVFETMVFGPDDYTDVIGRFATWSEAEMAHAECVERLRRKL